MSEMISKLWRRVPRSFGRPDPSVAAVFADSSEATIGPVMTSGARYYNREISDLQFIGRIVEESLNEAHPLLERLRFLAISASVLDQFYTIRVCQLKHSAQKQDAYITPDGMRPVQQFREVVRRGNLMLRQQQDTWLILKGALTEHGIKVLESPDLAAEDVSFLHYYFSYHILPVLTPFTVDIEHPFPFVPSGGVCAILEFSNRHILVPLPESLSRFVALPGTETRLTTLETVLFRFWSDLFPHDTLLSSGVFQVLRDNELARQERSDDLRSIIESGLRMRHRANTILLKVSRTMSERSIAFVADHLHLLSEQEMMRLEQQRKQVNDSEYVFRAAMPGLAKLSDLLNGDVAKNHAELQFAPYSPRVVEFGDCFAAIREHDVLMHWPYESFDGVVNFVSHAARDPNVLSIKQTLYRTSDDSPVVDAIIEAAQNGKAVTTIIELEARENESSNVQLAKRLEAGGVQIIYGIVGLKVHCKMTLVVRREDDETVLYAHLSTGNYHPVTARLYTDLSYFTCDKQLCGDANRVFNYITSGTMQPMEKLVVAPLQFRNKIAELIDNEIANARSGRPARICIKVNSMTDPSMIERLYAASEAGVDIDLVVRRHCALIPGVEGMSSRIRVKSLMGRYLEHSRIYLFANGHGLDSDESLVFFGSPDLMERNLDERVELLVPVHDKSVRHRLVNEIMVANLLDTAQSWILTANNEYVRHKDRDGLSAQSWFMNPDPEGLGRLKAEIRICTGD